jgi:hypothetical protein
MTLREKIGEIASTFGASMPTMIQETGFALDSPLEGDGFEPSVPVTGYCGVFRERGLREMHSNLQFSEDGSSIEAVP